MNRLERNAATAALQLLIAGFFLLLGIMSILPNLPESIFSLSNENIYIELISGIIALASGAILFFGIFIPRGKRGFQAAGLMVLLFWIVRLVFTLIMNGIFYTEGKIVFSPDLFSWLLLLFIDLIVLVCIVIIIKRYSRRR